MSPKDFPATDRETLDLIFLAIDGQEWTGDTIAAISVILTAAGYTVRGPLLAYDFGEREPEPERAPAPVDVDTTVKLNTLDTIARLMDGQEWDSSTASEISERLTAAGYLIREPLEAEERGEA